ncbi:MAG: hypothetical protein MRZ79_15170 [Bacteroidia bacterium]|nr:hypothetical protein [Bacteroidia bacterium]
MKYYFPAVLLCLFIACKSGEPDPQLKQAFELHEIAIQKHDSLENELTALDPQSLSAEGQQKLTELKKASTNWEESVVEVPGFEHEHEEGHDHEGHDHDHHHDHASTNLKDLPPSEILKLQQALVDEAQRLLDEFRQLAVKYPNTASLND